MDQVLRNIGDIQSDKVHRHAPDDADLVLADVSDRAGPGRIPAECAQEPVSIAACNGGNARRPFNCVAVIVGLRLAPLVSKRQRVSWSIAASDQM